MSKAKLNKVLAGMLAATMVLGMSATAFASDTTSGSGTGAGDFEGHVNKEILAVTLPTDGDTSTFKYIVDPEGLIAETDHAKYANATFESGSNVFFQSSTDNYTKDSAKLKVINKGSVAADVTVKAETAASDKVTMAASDTFTGTNCDLYLGLKVADKNAVAVQTTGGTAASVTVGLAGNEDNYETTYDSSNGYKYTVKSGTPDTAWNSFEFYLTGKCNDKGVWKDITSDKVPAVTVTWTYAQRANDSTAEMLTENATNDVAPSIATSGTYDKATGTITATVNLGLGTKVTTLKTAKYGSSVAKATNDVVEPTINGTTFTGKASDAVKNGWANLAGPVYVVIELNDGTRQEVTLTMQ